jgi:hypothetical protein
MIHFATRNAPAADINLRVASLATAGSSIEAVLSTGADVQRSGFVERLGTWATLPSRIPLLDSHRRDSVDSIIGYCDNIRSENGTIRATIHVSDSRPDVLQKIRDGSIASTSIGFSAATWRDQTENGQRIRVADSITLHEASLVCLGADTGARLRSLATTLNVPDSYVSELQTRGLNEEQQRNAIIQRAAERNPVVDTRVPATVTRDGRDSLTARMADGLLSRILPGHSPQIGREFAHATIADLARRFLSESGLSTFGSATDIVQRALGGLHSTSDFASVFGESFSQALLTLRATPSPVQQIFKKGTAVDFRSRHVYEVGDGPPLLKVNEHGEIKSGTIGAKELSAYKIDSYGRIFGLTFAAMVNDDVGALSDISGKMTRGARRWYETFLIDTIIRNPPLADGKAVFHVDHDNLAAPGSVPSDASINEGRMGMRMQTDSSGSPLNAAPKYLLIPAAFETVVDQLLATLYPATPELAVTAARGLIVLVDPRLDASSEPYAWYLFADSSVSPTFEVAELSGFEGPRVESRSGFDILGMEWRVVWHLGAGAVDSRGGWKNPGAAPAGLTRTAPNREVKR